MWMYSGPNDMMRLHCEDNDKYTVDNVLSALFVSSAVPAVDQLPTTLRPLHQYNLTERMAILEGMPPFTPTGRQPCGERKRQILPRPQELA